MKQSHFFFIFIFVQLVSGCDKATDNTQQKGPNLPLVTVAQVQRQSIEITEDAIGSIEGLIDPTLASEVPAKVLKVHVGVGDRVKKGQLVVTLDAGDYLVQRNEALAEVARIEALLSNQAKTVARNRALVDKKFISQTAVDNDLAQEKVLKEQLAGAKARVDSINHNSSKTRIYAPNEGIVERKIVDSGEYVRAGDPILQIIGNQKLRAHIPVPENIAAQIRPGQPVRLTTPTSSSGVTTKVKEIKPLVLSDSRSVDVIADIDNQPDWQAGASVNAQIVLSKKEGVITVPEQSVVLRPAGEVVYVIQNNVAEQKIVKTGAEKNGLIEILSGLQDGQKIAVDGAAYLTDKAQVKISSTIKGGS
ncbi:MAG TPA: efflux RND transporter periplasmic adaptor subunit [Methylophilus sp.]|nr:efflux RND transporter periplasmic adaptor subunit [Methylophilus sp.]HQQ32757.1 efflux RND transporter periplasmic adaptor subunit [Methylophilus sp.]